MTFESFDVLVVPFPFTERAAGKRRSVFVLSHAGAFNEPVGRLVPAMTASG